VTWLVLVAVFAVLLLLAVPIAVVIGVASGSSLLLSVEPLAAFTTLAQRVATGLDSFALLAIPFFILSGQLMNRGGMARRLVDLGRALVGGLPGGLAFVNILACVLFGSVSGSAVAAAAAIGSFMTPMMEKEGYSREYGAAVNVSSATTGLLIPPSNILIVYSLASGGVSIAALFVAGYLPGLLMAALLAVVAAALARRNAYPAGTRQSMAMLGRRFLAAAPSLVLVVIVMGGIIGGLFTATEAAGVAVIYALALTVLVYREIGLRELPEIILDSAATTGVVLFLIGASMGMSWVMAYANLPQAIAAGLLGFAAGPLLLLLVMNVLLLAVGTFMDMTPAVLIFTPIFLPVATSLGIDPIHFGIVMIMNLCVGLCTPPVGTVLFVGCGVAGIPVSRVIRTMMPLYAAMIVALALVTLVPQLSLFLPRLFGL
jgi:tripartite ATP-independent transporter DctM subunit